MRRLCLLITLTVISVPLLATADGDSNGSDKTAVGKNASSRKKEATRRRTGNAARTKVSLKSVSKEQESAAMRLVENHHDELLELLIHLKEGLPTEYDRAIRDLSRTSERLSQLEKRDKKRFELELALWKTKSHRQLLQARLLMDKDKALLGQIRETLNEERELHVAVLKHERDRLTNRIQRLNAQIAKKENNSEAEIERQLKTLTQPRKNVERRVNSKTRKSPAKKPT